MGASKNFNWKIVVIFFILVLFANGTGVLSATDIRGKSYSLSEILVIAKEKNPSRAIFQANVETARGKFTQARAYPNPELETAIGRGEGLDEPGTSYKREFSLGLSQVFEWPGKRFYRSKAAEALVDVARLDIENFQLDLLAEVKDAFYYVLLSNQLLEVSEKNVETSKTLLTSVKLRVDLGDAPELELIKAKVELLKATKDLKRAENKKTIAKAVLNSILGGTLEEGYEISDGFTRPEKNFDLPSLVKTALIQHPIILRQKKVLVAAGNELLGERQSLVPDLTVNGSVSEEVDKRSFAVGLSLSLPLFYLRSGEIAVALAEQKRAKAEFERIRLELTKLITLEFHNYQIGLDQLRIFEEGLLEQADEALRITRFSYEQGESDLINLLDAQRIQRITFSEYYEAQFELQSALVRLERVTGGLP